MRTGSPRTSFLMPVRDAAGTLPDALSSALAQTDPDLEVVAVDDGSADGSREILRAFAARDPRVCVLFQDRLGHVAALNRGLAHCRGRFVARLDADDRAANTRLERQIPLLERPGGPAVVDGRVRLFRDDGDVRGGMRRYERWINAVVEPGDFDRELLVDSPVVNPAATCARRLLLDLGGFRDGPFPEDYDLWLRAHARGARFRKVPEVLVWQRDHERRLTRRDPRFSRQAFRRVRLAWLEAVLLESRPRIALWGGGREARVWLRTLLERGHDVRFAIEIDPRRIGARRHGRIPVVSYKSLPELEIDLLLVAVATWDAREEIRAEVARLRPDLAEGRRYFHLC